MSGSNILSLFRGLTVYEKIASAFVLLTGLILTSIAYKLVSDAQQQRVLNAFEQEASNTSDALSNTLTRHAGLLLGLRGVYQSSEDLSRQQFHKFVQSIDKKRHYPEAAAISWNAIVPFDKVDEFESLVRSDTSLVASGYPDFKIKPAIEDGDTGMVVTFVEPMEGNENAFGFDIGSNPARRTAYEKARDTGEVVITEPIVLTQDSGSTQKAFLMLLATYTTQTPGDEQVRQATHSGQVVVVTRAVELIENNGLPAVDFFKVTDTTEGEELSDENKTIYNSGTLSSSGTLLETARDIVIGTRNWQLFFQQSQQLPLSDRVIKYVVAGLGTLATLLAVSLLGTMANSKLAAEQHAEKLTVDLQRANEELKRSNADLSQFAHVASHDLQTPVRNVISTVTLLEDHLGDSADPEINELFGLLTKSSVRMRTLVSDLLSYARLGRDAIEFKPVKLNDVLDEVRLATANVCEESRAQLHIDELPSMVGDARQLNRVFENLITNSIKYAHADRDPIIKISEGNGSAGFVNIRVTDNGQGITEEYQDMVFEPFKRLHRHDEIAGTGLGLGICKQIVERHGGSITIEQSSEDGTSFQILLPTEVQGKKSV